MDEDRRTGIKTCPVRRSCAIISTGVVQHFEAYYSVVRSPEAIVGGH